MIHIKVNPKILCWNGMRCALKLQKNRRTDNYEVRREGWSHSLQLPKTSIYFFKLF